MAHITRIQLEDNLAEIVTKITDGNIGSVTSLIRVMKLVKEVDPLSVFADLGPLLTLDNIGIYGSSIWILFKDVCKENPTVMLAVLRATQLGILTREQVFSSAIRQNGEEDFRLYDPIETYHKVKKYLGTFDPNNTAGL